MFHALTSSGRVSRMKRAKAEDKLWVAYFVVCAVLLAMKWT